MHLFSFWSDTLVISSFHQIVFVLMFTADSVMSMCTPDEEMLQDEDIPVSVEKSQMKKYRNESHLWFPEYEREVYEYLREAEVC